MHLSVKPDRGVMTSTEEQIRHESRGRLGSLVCKCQVAGCHLILREFLMLLFDNVNQGNKSTCHMTLSQMYIVTILYLILKYFSSLWF